MCENKMQRRQRRLRPGYRTPFQTYMWACCHMSASMNKPQILFSFRADYSLTRVGSSNIPATPPTWLKFELNAVTFTPQTVWIQSSKDSLFSWSWAANLHTQLWLGHFSDIATLLAAQWSRSFPEHCASMRRISYLRPGSLLEVYFKEFILCFPSWFLTFFTYLRWLESNYIIYH